MHAPRFRHTPPMEIPRKCTTKTWVVSKKIAYGKLMPPATSGSVAEAAKNDGRRAIRMLSIYAVAVSAGHLKTNSTDRMS